MARRNHLDDFTRGRMIGKLEEGRTVTSVSAEYGINKSVVSRTWKAFQTTVEKRPTAVNKCHCSATLYSNGATSDAVYCGQMPSQRGLFAHRPERCLRLKVGHRRHCLQWCREHKNWTTDQWSHVLFTDERRFSTRSDSQRVLIWREIGTRFYSSNKERHRYGGPGVLVWGGIMLNGRTELHIFDRGSVTGDRYCEEVLLPHVRLFRGAISPDFIFMDYNDRPHRTLAVEELLESEDITRMDWPAYSPDLNPIEHLWDTLGRRITARLHHPENTQQLKQVLIEEWVLLPQEMLHQLVLRVNAQIAAFERAINTFCDRTCEICTKRCYPNQVTKCPLTETKTHLPNELGNKPVLLLCHHCKKHINSNKVRSPPKAYWNNLDLGLIPRQLQELCQVDIRLLTRIKPFIKIIKFDGLLGQYGFREQAILFAQDLSEVTEKLPNVLPGLNNNLDVIVVTETLENLNILRELSIDRSRVNRALKWLVAENELFKDVVINQESRMEESDYV
ncbi:transposable element Tcb2 transposase [Trichonephila clavipes]|nr:transposable element Tcb2 transposase [Trichonephila clavipes]